MWQTQSAGPVRTAHMSVLLTEHCYTIQHGAVLIIFPLNLHTITITRMLSSGGYRGGSKWLWSLIVSSIPNVLVNFGTRFTFSVYWVFHAQYCEYQTSVYYWIRHCFQWTFVPKRACLIFLPIFLSIRSAWKSQRMARIRSSSATAQFAQ